MKKRKHLCALSVLIAVLVCLCACRGLLPAPSAPSVEFAVPDYSGEPFSVVNGGEPFFSEELYTTDSFESYAPLDALGRCGVAFACVGQDLMPTEERGSIGQVKPSGWQTVKYDCVEGKYLYNRCHLIGFQLSGENANEQNLITGTRFFNTQAMLPFENMVADYVRETDNHVLYRVTPVFEGQELVARGVLLEAYSVEDSGEGVEFCVFCHNVQPGVELHYATGESRLAEEKEDATEEAARYVLNKSSKKFHLPTCEGAKSMSEKNRQDYHGTRASLLLQGYEPCGSCRP